MKLRHYHALSAGLFLASLAQAQQVLSYFAEIPESAADWTQTVQLPGFDANLGTLTQVKLSFTGEIWQDLSAENTAAGAANYDLSTTAFMSFGRMCSPVLFKSSPITLHQTGRVGAFDGAVDFIGSSGVHFSGDYSFAGIYVDPVLTDYLSRGSIAFNVSAKSIASLLSGCNFAQVTSTSAAASLRVEYAYAAIPEPSACAAILGAFALIAVELQRRRTRRSVESVLN